MAGIVGEEERVHAERSRGGRQASALTGQLVEAYAQSSAMRQASIFLLCFGLVVACASQQRSPAGSAACTAKDGAKYDASSMQDIEARLGREASQVAWEEVAEPYRPWASGHLTRKVSRAAATLAESSNCREVEAAASKLRALSKRIAEAAKKCTDEQCLTKGAEAPALDAELELALCPLYPFC
jgi:hypothetical protein